MPIISSRPLRQRFRRTARLPHRGGAVDEENHSRAEEQREQPHELLVDENLTEYAHCPVEPGLGAAALMFRYGGRPNLNDTAFISSMPSTAAAAYEVEAGYSRGFAYRA